MRSCSYDHAALISVLNEQETQCVSTPQTLMLYENSGLYSHYSMPFRRIQDIRKAGKERNNGSQDKSEVSLPNVLEVRLPSSPECLRKMCTSNSNASSTAPQQNGSLGNSSTFQQSSTALESAELINGNDIQTAFSSHTAEEFGNRIPDLSFMLASTLVLPVDASKSH
jgi:hypothetical protein